jgi:hypothetical protein
MIATAQGLPMLKVCQCSNVICHCTKVTSHQGSPVQKGRQCSRVATAQSLPLLKGRHCTKVALCNLHIEFTGNKQVMML